MGWRETVRESEKWDPMNNVDESRETKADGIEDYH